MSGDIELDGETYSNMVCQIANQGSLIQTLHAEVERLKAELDAAMHARCANFDAISAERDALRAEVERLKAELAAVTAHFTRTSDISVEWKIGKRAEIAASGGTTASRLDGLLTQAEYVVDSFERENERLKAELAAFRETVGVRADVAATANDRDHWVKLMDRADESVRLRAEVERLKAELAEAQKEVGKWRSDFDAEREAHAKTKAENERLKAELDAAMHARCANFDAISAERDALREVLVGLWAWATQRLGSGRHAEDVVAALRDLLAEHNVTLEVERGHQG